MNRLLFHPFIPWRSDVCEYLSVLNINTWLIQILLNKSNHFHDQSSNTLPKFSWFFPRISKIQNQAIELAMPPSKLITNQTKTTIRLRPQFPNQTINLMKSRSLIFYWSRKHSSQLKGEIFIMNSSLAKAIDRPEGIRNWI